MYRLRNGSTKAGEAIGNELERILNEHDGQLRPADIVEAAKAADNVLHQRFEWDDTVAAQEWRLEQARQLIMSVVIVRDETPERQIRAFVNVEHEGAWEPLGRVLDDHEKKALLLKQALDALAGARSKYETLGELADVWRAVDRVVAKITKKAKLVA